MTFAKLKELISKHNIPEDAALRSDSGWECGATEMDGVYYNQERNEIIFTQERESCIEELRIDGCYYTLLI